jgi:sarcosine oxidase subunit alpha
MPTVTRPVNSHRLASGGRIDRGRPLSFRFNGRELCGFAGDTLASALLANGVRLVGRSWKYHRPRGIMTAGVDDPNSVIQLVGAEDEPNVMATCLPLREGLEARSANCWPSVRFDVGSINDRLHAVFSAGFYYKTFLWPAHGWNFYGHFVRRAAGVGRAPRRHDATERYEKRFHHCDILVVGAGPAGLAAALAAGRSGARVMLVDEQTEAGGQLLCAPAMLDSRPGEEWIARTATELAAMPHVLHLQRSCAIGYYDHNMIYVVEQEPRTPWLRERLWRVRARQTILATGALERPLVFADNDRPGVMLASAAGTYVHRFAVVPGRIAVVVTNNDSAYDAAVTLANGGVRVAVIVDTRTKLPEAKCAAAHALGIEVLPASTVVGVRGRHAVSAVDIAAIDGSRPPRRIACDLLATSGGWNPVVHLHAQSGGRPRYESRIKTFVPGTSVQAETSVGAAAGEMDIALCLAQGSSAGWQAATALGFAPGPITLPSTANDAAYSIEAAWELPLTPPGSRAFVDLGNDVTADDVRLALRENYESVELVKRYTTAGMAIDQGKLGNANIIGLIAQTTGRDPDEVGTTTFRPLYRPVSFGVWAGIDRGEVIVPARRTPITPWFEQAGAYFDEAGASFRRPFYLPRAGESPSAAVAREAVAARTTAGIYDGTPLGKFELTGPDVVTLLNRVYTNRWDSLKIGAGRFGWMLREDGRLFDDGVTFRLGEQHYLMSTGSGAADAVHAHLERLLQCEWRDLNVFVTPVTEQWANVCVCGPRARDVLMAAGSTIDLSPPALPFMAIRIGRIGGFEARVARVSYTGELSFEINVGARYGLELWNLLLEAGKAYDITPLGSETSLLLRLEKGFVAAWAEGDGYVTPTDAGLDWVINQDKGDFIGKRSLQRDRHVGGTRPNIVGLLPVDPSFVPPDGAPLIDPEEPDETRKVIGFVTAGGFSPNLSRSIALAQLDDGRSQIGKHVLVSSIGRQEAAVVAQPVFIDPAGARMKS